MEKRNGKEKRQEILTARPVGQAGRAGAKRLRREKQRLTGDKPSVSCLAGDGRCHLPLDGRSIFHP